MEANPAFRDAFERLTPGRQRGYLLHFKLRGPRIEGDLSTRLAALRGTDTGRLLSHGRLGCGDDRLKSGQVPAQGLASWLGECYLPPGTCIRPHTGNLHVPGSSEG